MTNNDMGPAFGFILVGMLALLFLTSITSDPNNALISRAMKVLDEKFSESSIPDIQNPKDDEMIFTESGPSESLSW
ncbi:MAG: hypothetical protein II969_12370 [Anaerolineaceae bacterium]|nr:hypothetical protein [Anaerolineaceae bacterium]